jgi:actin
MAASLPIDRAVNERWMEALDTSSGRLYYIELEINEAGDVRPTGTTAWQPPVGFLTRSDLIAALLDDEAFLARVKQRFPPPSSPPPSSSSTDDGAGPVKSREFKRGASSSSLGAGSPPPPPAWAMKKVASQRSTTTAGAVLPVVLDCASAVCRVGVAGDSVPRAAFPSIIARPHPDRHDPRILITMRDHCGHEATAELARARKDYLLKCPIECTITNFDDVSLLWQHALSSIDATCSPSGGGAPDPDRPVVLAEAACETRRGREKMVQTWFEVHKASRLALVPTPVLVALAHGRSTALVIESGAMLNNVVAVHEGVMLSESLARPFYYRGFGSCFAGRAVTDRLIRLMGERGYNVCTRAEADFVETIKEKHAYVALDAAAAATSDKEVRVPLPDGVEIEGSHLEEGAGGARYLTLGDELSRCAEELFTPKVPEVEQGDGVVAGLHEIAWQVVNNSPAELRATLCANVLVAGGNAALPGFAARLEKELGALAAAAMLEVRVSEDGPADSSLAAWVGASRFAASEAFGRLSISSDEYEEHGPELVHRRCPH